MMVMINLFYFLGIAVEYHRLFFIYYNDNNNDVGNIILVYLYFVEIMIFLFDNNVLIIFFFYIIHLNFKAKCENISIQNNIHIYFLMIN